MQMDEQMSEKWHKELLRELMDSRIGEWAALVEIEKLRKKLRDRKRYLKSANRGAERNAQALQLALARNKKLLSQIRSLRARLNHKEKDAEKA